MTDSTTAPDLPTQPPVQIVITRSPTGGFKITNMSATVTLNTTLAPTREHALAAVADYMTHLLLP